MTRFFLIKKLVHDISLPFLSRSNIVCPINKVFSPVTVKYTTPTNLHSPSSLSWEISLGLMVVCFLFLFYERVILTWRPWLSCLLILFSSFFTDFFFACNIFISFPPYFFSFFFLYVPHNATSFIVKTAGSKIGHVWNLILWAEHICVSIV